MCNLRLLNQVQANDSSSQHRNGRKNYRNSTEMCFENPWKHHCTSFCFKNDSAETTSQSNHKLPQCKKEHHVSQAFAEESRDTWTNNPSITLKSSSVSVKFAQLFFSQESATFHMYQLHYSFMKLELFELFPSIIPSPSERHASCFVDILCKYQGENSYIVILMIIHLFKFSQIHMFEWAEIFDSSATSWEKNTSPTGLYHKGISTTASKKKDRIVD